MLDVAEELVVNCDWHYTENFHDIVSYNPEPWRTKHGQSGWDRGGTIAGASIRLQSYEVVVREDVVYVDC